MISERRSEIVPPEITKGSTSGSVSSKSSARVIRIRKKIEEVQLATVPREGPGGFALQHDGDEAIAGLEDERMQRALGARSMRRRVRFERELKKRMELDRRAPAQCVFDDQATAGNVSRATQGRSDGRSVRREIKHPQISIAQFWPAVRDAELRVEESVEHDECIGGRRSPHHLALKAIVEAGVHEFHRESHVGLIADAGRYLAKPSQNLLLLLRQWITRERR